VWWAESNSLTGQRPATRIGKPQNDDSVSQAGLRFVVLMMGPTPANELFLYLQLGKVKVYAYYNFCQEAVTRSFSDLWDFAILDANS
jgi:hypothetical protein